MQIIYLDISNKGVVHTIYAKQGDVGRKFEVVLTDSGLPYIPANGSAFSVWYSGASGEGNYTDIGDKSAFSVNGNKVIVEMITQMLSNDGEGTLSLVLNDIVGNQIGLWNIHYVCESVPGAKSEEAKEYYTAFSENVKTSVDAASRAESAAKKADIAVKKAVHRNLLDNSDFRNPVNQRGETVYTGNTYTIDRWLIAGNAAEQNTFWISEDGYIGLSGGDTSERVWMVQRVPSNVMQAGSKATFAVMQNGGALMILNINSWGSDSKIDLPHGVSLLYQAGELIIINGTGSPIGIVWAALYEGEYTAKTLPEYQPKGYGAELAECQRYYQIRSTNNIAVVDMRPTMRLSSPTITSVTGGYAYSADL